MFVWVLLNQGDAPPRAHPGARGRADTPWRRRRGAFFFACVLLTRQQPQGGRVPTTTNSCEEENATPSEERKRRWGPSCGLSPEPDADKGTRAPAAWYITCSSSSGGRFPPTAAARSQRHASCTIETGCRCAGRAVAGCWLRLWALEVGCPALSLI